MDLLSIIKGENSGELTDFNNPAAPQTAKKPVSVIPGIGVTDNFLAASVLKLAEDKNVPAKDVLPVLSDISGQILQSLPEQLSRLNLDTMDALSIIDGKNRSLLISIQDSMSGRVTNDELYAHLESVRRSVTSIKFLLFSPITYTNMSPEDIASLSIPGKHQELVGIGSQLTSGLWAAMLPNPDGAEYSNIYIPGRTITEDLAPAEYGSMYSQASVIKKDSSLEGVNTFENISAPDPKKSGITDRMKSRYKDLARLAESSARELTDPRTYTNAIEASIRTYGENMWNSVISSAGSAVSMLKSGTVEFANSVVTGIVQDIVSSAKNAVLGQFGFSDGKDNAGRLRILSDRHEPGKPPADASSGGILGNISSKAKRYLNETVVRSINSAISGVTGPLSKVTDSVKNRFLYYKTYSGGRVLTDAGRNMVTIEDIKTTGINDSATIIGADRYFKGIEEIINLDARVERYFDFTIDTPISLKKKGLPPFMTRPIQPYTIEQNYNGTALSPLDNVSVTRLNPVTLYQARNGSPVPAKNLSKQANITNIDTLKLGSGPESLSLGMFGDVCMTSRVMMLSNINMEIVEDTSLSVRTWMEDYLNYMYNGKKAPGAAASLADASDSSNPALNYNPNLSRPIYQGYYSITFYMLDSLRNNILRQRTFYGVPRFDMSIIPNPSEAKTYRINWEIIGEEGIKPVQTAKRHVASEISSTNTAGNIANTGANNINAADSTRAVNNWTLVPVKPS